ADEGEMRFDDLLGGELAVADRPGELGRRGEEDFFHGPGEGGDSLPPGQSMRIGERAAIGYERLDMTLGSAASGLTFQTPLIFEQGAPGRSGASLPPLDVPEVDPKAHFGDLAREASPGLPEVSEPEAVRHYVRLSQQNFAIDTGMYPLGSCTMKYNPKVNEWAARLSGFANLHPLTPDALAQGALELMHRLELGLAGVCGMAGVTLHPSAGAQGEYVGLMMIRASHQAQGRSPKKVLIPD